MLFHFKVKPFENASSLSTAGNKKYRREAVFFTCAAFKSDFSKFSSQQENADITQIPFFAGRSGA